ncbi:DUF6226 family protein [Demequina globuliformis]|uniref:DUF6226 family protein n=1 Tax=Demequina globuliformis TaxID=676202 RepID=UPI00078196B3|nr:DUF6226 family protein [Demequina globuliformis]
MSVYRRPEIVEDIFRDEHGAVIDYGNRWDMSPPDDTYSVCAHPERFAPLHTVANALIDNLIATYDVEVDEGEHVVRDLIRGSGRETVRAVRLRPRDPRCAPLTFVLNDHPGVELHVGALLDEHYPVCGCDACDESWQESADDLEKVVFAVAAGGLDEWVGRGPRARVGFRLTYPAGSQAGESRAKEFPRERIVEARRTLKHVRGAWRAWS